MQQLYRSIYVLLNSGMWWICHIIAWGQSNDEWSIKQSEAMVLSYCSLCFENLMKGLKGKRRLPRIFSCVSHLWDVNTEATAGYFLTYTSNAVVVEMMHSKKSEFQIQHLSCYLFIFVALLSLSLWIGWVFFLCCGEVISGDRKELEAVEEK